jgi:hypothetical protein
VCRRRTRGRSVPERNSRIPRSYRFKVALSSRCITPHRPSLTRSGVRQGHPLATTEALCLLAHLADGNYRRCVDDVNLSRPRPVTPENLYGPAGKSQLRDGHGRRLHDGVLPSGASTRTGRSMENASSIPDPR